LPVRPGKTGSSSSSTKFFSELDPASPSRARSRDGSGPVIPGAPPAQLAVHEVGSFEASFVPSHDPNADVVV
jgi:hypothetical protein